MRKFLWVISLLLIGLKGFASVPVEAVSVKDSLTVDRNTIEPTRFPENFKDDYKGEEYIYERTVDTEGWFTKFKRWLSELIKNWFDVQSDTSASEITQLLINLFYIFIIIAVIYIIVRAIMNGEGRWVFGKSSDKKVIPVEDLEQNIHSVDFKKEIAKHAAAGDFRLAIRYYYLFILKKLTDSGSIEYDVEKTNADYLNELSFSAYQDDFGHTSYLYNYIWYGEFPVDATGFEKAKVPFERLLNQIKS